MSGSRWRALAGLLILLAAVAQSTVGAQDSSQRGLVVALAAIIAVAWFLQLSRWLEVGVWLLGLASAALMLAQPGPGAAIGAIASLVFAGSRLPVRRATVFAAVVVPTFVAADLLSGRGEANLVGTALTATGLAFSYFAALSVRRIREERERAQALLEELQQTRAAEIERAALAERARIAREIHDVLAHTLSSLAVQLEGTRMLVEQRPGDPTAVAAIERAHRLATEGLAEARRAIGALRGDRLPGTDGLQRLVEEFGEATGTPSHFEVTGEPTPLGAEAELALYRTAQEALTNVRKHARAADSVDVCLRYTTDGAELLVEDATPAAAVSANGSASGGYGLVGMRERAELAGGTLDAGPLPTGFRVRLWLPKA